MVYVIFPQAGPKSGLNLTSSVISLTREAVFYNIDAGKTIVEKVILKPYPSMKKIFFLILSRGQRQEWFFLSGYAWKSKSLKLYKQIYETINFEIFDRQSFSWWVGPENFFLSFKSACLNIGKSLKLYKQIYETLKFEMVDTQRRQSVQCHTWRCCCCTFPLEIQFMLSLVTCHISFNRRGANRPVSSRVSVTVVSRNGQTQEPFVYPELLQWQWSQDRRA